MKKQMHFWNFYLKPADGISRILLQLWQQTSILRLHLVDFQSKLWRPIFTEIYCREINFRVNFFPGMQIWYISRWFISMDGEVLIISSGIIFVATKHISMVFIVFILEKENL